MSVNDVIEMAEALSLPDAEVNQKTMAVLQDVAALLPVAGRMASTDLFKLQTRVVELLRLLELRG